MGGNIGLIRSLLKIQISLYKTACGFIFIFKYGNYSNLTLPALPDQLLCCNRPVEGAVKAGGFHIQYSETGSGEPLVLVHAVTVMNMPACL